MPHKYPAALRRQVIELARSGTKVAQLAETFGMSDATIETAPGSASAGASTPLRVGLLQDLRQRFRPRSDRPRPDLTLDWLGGN